MVKWNVMEVLRKRKRLRLGAISRNLGKRATIKKRGDFSSLN